MMATVASTIQHHSTCRGSPARLPVRTSEAKRQTDFTWPVSEKNPCHACSIYTLHAVGDAYRQPLVSHVVVLVTTLMTGNRDFLEAVQAVLEYKDPLAPVKVKQ